MTVTGGGASASSIIHSRGRHVRIYWQQGKAESVEFTSQVEQAGYLHCICHTWNTQMCFFFSNFVGTESFYCVWQFVGFKTRSFLKIEKKNMTSLVYKCKYKSPNVN